jgi:hypothetical protein
MNCKHRWEPTAFGHPYRSPDMHIYVCARCNKSIFAQLKAIK